MRARAVGGRKLSEKALRTAPSVGKSARRSDRVDRRKLRTRRALIDATQMLLASRSLESLSIDDISTRADVAKGTFYNYFADKDALAREVVANVRAVIETEITQINTGVEDHAARVARAFACVLHFGLTQPARARAMRRMFPHTTDPLAPTNSGLRADISGGLKNGRFCVASEEAAVVFTMGVTQAGLSHATDLGDSANVIRLARELGVEPRASDEIDRSSGEGGLRSE
jgi:AcrR family transcriptional regulator